MVGQIKVIILKED